MAPKKRKSTTGPTKSPRLEFAKKLVKILVLYALAALVSPLSQLSLAPVYGSIPSEHNSLETLALAWAAAYVSRLICPQHDRVVARYLPLWSACMFVLQYLPFKVSEHRGLDAGPIWTQILGCFLVVWPIVYVAAAALEDCFPRSGHTRILVWLFECVAGFLYFKYLAQIFASRLPDLMALWPHLNPFNLQILTSLSLTLLLPQSSTLFLTTILLTNLLALTFPYGSGPYSTALLQASLTPQNWTLLARHWSTTGYISVLENTAAHYRVLRCDHSLLGGEWLLTPARLAQNWHVPESIYAVFHLLEAVRLLSPIAIPDPSASALVLGLGIGTAPSALITHNITTTILELDPVIHHFATNYFSLPPNHTIHLTNAVPWVSAHAHNPSTAPQYDYILHDVFTGGAEPLPLFTAPFLRNLRSLLKPHGVAAINYAGDLALPLTARILHTISTVFDDQCALYRDSLDATQEFSNFVVFCRNAPSSEPIAFRKPDEGDFLGSHGRRSYLWPREGQRVEFPGVGEGGVLEERDVESGVWRRELVESARRHWGIMRTVLPAGVWEGY